MLSLFGKKYKDDEIMLCAENALELESMVDSSNLAVSSQKGIVTLQGRARTERDKSRAMDAVLNSLQGSRLKFERVEDQISLAA